MSKAPRGVRLNAQQKGAPRGALASVGNAPHSNL